jgi:DNA-binding NtrC family response regulator
VDDQRDLPALKEWIEPAGHECCAYQNPRKAFQHFKRETFDAVICDLRMPEVDGLQLLNAIQEFKPGTPVVILTGYADVESAISAVNQGAFAFLQKPIKLRELLDTLTRIGRMKRLRRNTSRAAESPYGEKKRFSQKYKIGINE